MTNNLTPTNEYFLFLLPVKAKTIKSLIDERLDMLEYQDSIIYHEFPDKNELLRQLEMIYTSPTFPDSSEDMKDLAWTMFMYEIVSRRNRYFEIISSTDSTNLR